MSGRKPKRQTRPILPRPSHQLKGVLSCKDYQTTKADPGFLEMGFIFKGVRVRFADFISVFLNIP